GYMIGIDGAYGLQNQNNMAIHSSLGLIVLSCGIIYDLWKNRPIKLKNDFLSFPISIGIFTIFILLGISLRNEERKFTHELIGKEVKKIEEIFYLGVQSRIDALLRMAERDINNVYP